jgi:hypothetical protein
MYLYYLRVSWHVSVNHGVNCLFQRFGFLNFLAVVILTTPIFSPSAIMKLSISLALLSLSSMYLSIISLNSVANYVVEVCVFHFIAFTLYSLIFSPSNHLHLILPLHILASEAV